MLLRKGAELVARQYPHPLFRQVDEGHQLGGRVIRHPPIQTGLPLAPAQRRPEIRLDLYGVRLLGDRMLNIARAMMVLAAVFSAQTMGQGTALDGKWTAKFVLPSGTSTGAAVVIRGTEGTWTSHGAPRNNPCVGKETQIAVDQTSTDAASIKILYSKRLTGCEDGGASLKLVDGVLKGHLGAGLPVELNRD